MSMGKRIPMVNGDEQDVLVRRARQAYCWTQRAGETARVKRSYRRRERALARRALRTEERS